MPRNCCVEIMFVENLLLLLKHTETTTSLYLMRYRLVVVSVCFSKSASQGSGFKPHRWVFPLPARADRARAVAV